MRWHDDGHTIFLQLNKSEVRVIAVLCPHAFEQHGPCKHPDAVCVVEWFLLRFGLECNVGVCDPAPEIKVAWSYVGDIAKSLDMGQVWVIPISDEAFAAWLITQSE